MKLKKYNYFFKKSKKIKNRHEIVSKEIGISWRGVRQQCRSVKEVKSKKVLEET